MHAHIKSLPSRRAPLLKIYLLTVLLATIQVSAPPAHERIAELAYSFWLSRGCQDGNPQDDWFRAEHELRSRLG